MTEPINCPMATAGIGSNGHGSMNAERQALKTHTTVKKV